MAISKKGLRKITVDGEDYLWRATSDDDGGFVIAVSSPDRTGQLLRCYVNILNAKRGILIITNYIVRQIVRLGLTSGWMPGEVRAPLNLNSVNDRLDFSKAIFRNPER